jgi:hypothetical protein
MFYLRLEKPLATPHPVGGRPHNVVPSEALQNVMVAAQVGQQSGA